MKRCAMHNMKRGVRGLSMVEVVVSIMIVGVMAAGAMRTIGAARMGQYRTAVRAQGQMLAQELMNEIMSQSYAEPTGTATFGRESGESATSRANYDDVDDYNGWTASPPQKANGTVRTDLADWTRSVTVTRVNATNPGQTASSETGVKRITVTIKHRGMVTAQLNALRCELSALEGGKNVTDLLEALSP